MDYLVTMQVLQFEYSFQELLPLEVVPCTVGEEETVLFFSVLQDYGNYLRGKKSKMKKDVYALQKYASFRTTADLP